MVALVGGIAGGEGAERAKHTCLLVAGTATRETKTKAVSPCPQHGKAVSTGTTADVSNANGKLIAHAAVAAAMAKTTTTTTYSTTPMLKNRWTCQRTWAARLTRVVAAALAGAAASVKEGARRAVECAGGARDTRVGSGGAGVAVGGVVVEAGWAVAVAGTLYAHVVGKTVALRAGIDPGHEPRRRANDHRLNNKVRRCMGGGRGGRGGVLGAFHERWSPGAGAGTQASTHGG